jgi:hypothetical protein
VTLRLNILGFEIARVELDFGEEETPAAPIAAKGVKAMSRLWIKGMLAG